MEEFCSYGTVPHEYLSSFYQFIPNILHSIINNNIDPIRNEVWFHNFVISGIKCASLIKHPAFREEAEFRISYGIFNNRQLIDLHEKDIDGNIIPVLELFGDCGVVDLIREIIVGPHVDSGTKVDLLDEFLKGHGIDWICIREVDLPLRV